MANWIIVDIVNYLYKPHVITGKLLATTLCFYFVSLKHAVRRAQEEEKNDKKAKMKGGLCWIRGLRGQEQDMSSLAL